MENKEFAGRVCLVGAGCSVGLMTLEGLARLQEAQVVLYDALLDPAILGAIPAGAEAIPVGKRCGRHSLKQAEINALLVEKAREGKRVVRLKGGDSFVLGRGGEELQALQEAGIPCDVVPGVTSAVAVPEHLGIPVTHRGVLPVVHGGHRPYPERRFGRLAGPGGFAGDPGISHGAGAAAPYLPAAAAARQGTGDAGERAVRRVQRPGTAAGRDSGHH